MSQAPGRMPLQGCVDLHAHTNESDGTLTPAELVQLARDLGLDALAITDHDTLLGYEKAIPLANEAGLDLVCGIELNTRLVLGDKHDRRSVHVLAYFPLDGPTEAFKSWLAGEREARHNRNARLAERLQSMGVHITLEEVEAKGKTLAGRPHFARLLLDKGYVQSWEEAFDRYLGEQAPCFVQRHSKPAEEVIATIRSAGGIPVVAHPIRLGLPRDQERELLIRYRDNGLLGLEVYHSEHSPELQAHYLKLARELELQPTGGSDFHGTAKPNTRLGTGVNGNVRVPVEFLTGLRRLQAA